MSSKHARVGAVTALALVAVAVAVAVSASGGRTPTATSDEARAAVAVVDGIPERGGVLGDPDAPLTVVEYVDLQCPVCAAAAQQILPTVVQDYVRTGKVKLELRTLHFLGPDSERAARVAAGAERQNRLWRFVEAFYAMQGAENSGYVTDDFLRDVAAASGVDADAALAQAGSEFALRRLERANADATARGIDSTPTFTVAAGEGRPQVVTAPELLGVLERDTAT